MKARKRVWCRVRQEKNILHKGETEEVRLDKDRKVAMDKNTFSGVIRI